MSVDDELKALLAKAEAESDDAEAATLLHEAAQLLELRLDDPERALAVLLVAFRKDAAHPRIAADVERLAGRLGRWGDLLDEADAAMRAAADPTALADLWARVARWTRKLGRHAEAQEAAESALEIAPLHEGALIELEETHRALEQWGALGRVLGRRVRVVAEQGATADRGALLDLHLQIAALHEERLGDDDQAIAACEKALGLDRHNQAALLRLERLAARHGRTGLLLDVLARRLAAATAPTERALLGLQLATEWERFGRSGEACQVIDGLRAEGVSDAALQGLLRRILRETAQWTRFVAEAERDLAASEEPAERAAISLELGRVLLTELGEPDKAEPHIDRAFEFDDTRAEAAEVWLDHLRRTGAWTKLCTALLKLGNATAPPDQRAQALLEAAAVYRGKLFDEDTAREIWTWVVALDPRNEEAVQALAGDAEARKDWARLRGLLQPLCEQPGDVSAETRASWHARLARAAAALGERDQTLQELRAATRLAPDDLDLSCALAARLAEDGRLAEAAPVFERLWEAPAARFTDAERGEIALGLARARRAQGDLTGAAAAFERALALAPAAPGGGPDRQILDALAAIADDANDAAAAARWKRARLRAGADLPADRLIPLARATARLFAEPLGQPQEASAVLRDALAFYPESHELLADLLELHVAAEAWRPAVDVLTTLARLETGVARARHLVGAGNILSLQLHEDEEAVELYNDALDEDPEDYKTFERIDRILTKKRRFRDQERAYRTMLWRLRDRNDARGRAAQIMLWRGLGEIYRTRLRDFPAAASAFEMVAKLDQQDASTTRIILGELYEMSGPEAYGRAIEERRQLIAESADLRDMGNHLRAVRRVAMNMRDGDRAWRATDALVALDLADESERHFHGGRTADLQLPEAPMPAAGWSMLTHADENPELSQLFAAVGRGLIALRSRDHAGWGLRSQTEAEQDGVERSVLGRLLAHMAGILHVPVPGLQFRPDLPGTADMAGVRGGGSRVAPTLVAGADMLRVRSKRELACVMAKKVTLMRPEHYVLWPTVVPTLAELRVLLVALRRILDANTKVRPELERVLPHYERVLRRVLGPQDLERAAALVPSLSPEAAEVVGWARGAFLTASRVGYLMGSDLQTSLRTASVETVGSLRVTPFEQIRDLVTWSLSDPHMALRRQLGMAPLRPMEPASPPPAIAAPPTPPRIYDASGDPMGSRVYDAYEIARSLQEPAYAAYETGSPRGLQN